MSCRPWDSRNTTWCGTWPPATIWSASSPSIIPEAAEALIAKPNIHRLQELRGKKIALHRGTYLEYLLSVVAERDHLNLDEVTLVEMNGDEAIKAFAAGTIDAVLVWEPFVSEAKAAGGVQIFSAAGLPWPHLLRVHTATRLH